MRSCDKCRIASTRTAPVTAVQITEVHQSGGKDNPSNISYLDLCNPCLMQLKAFLRNAIAQWASDTVHVKCGD